MPHFLLQTSPFEHFKNNFKGGQMRTKAWFFKEYNNYDHFGRVKRQETQKSQLSFLLTNLLKN